MNSIGQYASHIRNQENRPGASYNQYYVRTYRAAHSPGCVSYDAVVLLQNYNEKFAPWHALRYAGMDY